MKQFKPSYDNTSITPFSQIELFILFSASEDNECCSERQSRPHNTNLFIFEGKLCYGGTPGRGNINVIVMNGCVFKLLNMSNCLG